jgi:hypothetical protein
MKHNPEDYIPVTEEDRRDAAITIAGLHNRLAYVEATLRQALTVNRKLTELIEERIEARSRPKPDGWARDWTRRAKAYIEGPQQVRVFRGGSRTSKK